MKQTAHGQPGRTQWTGTIAFELLPPAAGIALDSMRGESVCGVVDGIGVAPEKTLVVVCRTLTGEPGIEDALVAGHHVFFAGPVGGVRIIVVLVNDERGVGGVYDDCVQRARLPEQPVVPPETADGERRDRGIQAARERKVVDAAGNLQLALDWGTSAKSGCPVWMKVKGFFHVDIGTPADHEEIIGCGSDSV